MESGQIERYQTLFISVIKVIVTIVGIALVAIGVAALGAIGYFVFDIINSPESAQIIQWVQANLPKDEIVFSLQHGDELTTLKASHTLQYIVYALLAVMVVNGVIAIMKGLIVSGVELMRTSLFKF